MENSSKEIVVDFNALSVNDLVPLYQKIHERECQLQLKLVQDSLAVRGCALSTIKFNLPRAHNIALAYVVRLLSPTSDVRYGYECMVERVEDNEQSPEILSLKSLNLPDIPIEYLRLSLGSEKLHQLTWTYDRKAQLCRTNYQLYIWFNYSLIDKFEIGNHYLILRFDYRGNRIGNQIYKCIFTAAGFFRDTDFICGKDHDIRSIILHDPDFVR